MKPRKEPWVSLLCQLISRRLCLEIHYRGGFVFETVGLALIRYLFLAEGHFPERVPAVWHQADVSDLADRLPL